MVLLFPIALTILVLWAIANDIYCYRIPNIVNLAIIILFSIALFASNAPLSWQNALISFAVIFAVGFAFFIANIMGGGDVKMLAALSLWVEFNSSLLEFILIISVLGGLLTIGLILSRKYIPYLLVKINRTDVDIPILFSHGQPVPYGIAIGIAFLWLLWIGKLPIYPY